MKVLFILLLGITSLQSFAAKDPTSVSCLKKQLSQKVSIEKAYQLCSVGQSKK